MSWCLAITLGANVCYHLGANLTDPEFDASAIAAASNKSLAPDDMNLDTDQFNDIWTLGLTLGIEFRPYATPAQQGSTHAIAVFLIDELIER